ncbi:MAG: type II toxin-antitoxin system RelE/ParE family toxin [Chloroflexi bacterium]|nr:type II toxin-antitoxin system RelE/ParE family toxin [Chloroflexota bacterium]MCC6895979.1 type II toxin-antitoxin system RelE/ParE family toxin [Anaerolineae bacterium]
MTDSEITVILSDRFLKDVKQLLKKYRHVREDVQGLITELESGNVPGDQVVGTHYPVYKARIKNRDVSKGKSGGYRVIYYIKTSTRIYLVTLYSKSHQANIKPEVINQIIQDLGLPSAE